MEAFFKKSVLQIQGYTSPPQGMMRAKLNQNESPYDLPASLKQEILAEAANLSWNRYPVNESPELKKRLSAWYGVKPDQVLLGNGSNQLLQTVLSACVEKGNRVLYYPPTFGLFELFTSVYDGTAIEILRAPGQDFPLRQTLEAIDVHKPRLILLCSPNNPTGAEIDLEQVREICAQTSGLVLFDEAYAEFSEQSAIALLPDTPNLIVSRTFSKAFSLAGLRLGYLISHTSVIEELRKVNLPYNINLFTELVATHLLDDVARMHEQVAWIKTERDWLFQELGRFSALKVYPTAANFILFTSLKGLPLFSSLKEMGILVRDVSSYPLLENHLRVSVGSHEENLLFLDAIKTILS